MVGLVDEGVVSKEKPCSCCVQAQVQAELALSFLLKAGLQLTLPAVDEGGVSREDAMLTVGV